MDKCAVAFFDALGFKGIWRHFDPDHVLKKMQITRKYMEEAIADFNSTISGVTADGRIAIDPRVTIRFLSDSIVLVAAPVVTTTDPTLVDAELRDIIQREVALRQACAAAVQVGWVGAMCIESLPVSIAYRGAVAYGEVAVDDNFFVGPAIDEAVHLESSIDGAIIALTPEASQIADTAQISPFNMLIADYPIPLKDGTRSGHVINPVFAATDFVRNGVRLAFEILMKNRGDEKIERKWRNTEALLARCLTEPRADA